MTGEYTSAESRDGAGSIGLDGKAGQLANTVVTAVGLAVVSWINELDFSTFPRAISTLAPPAAGLVVGWITTKFLPRFRTR